jgi:hypothetical protein
MGKGAPQDYVLALQWAVISGQIPNPNQAAVQLYCDQNLGIDCSGFATNYLMAAGKLPFSHQTSLNSNAASYYRTAKAVNDSKTIRQGDLLVWMAGNKPKEQPGHIMIVNQFPATAQAGGTVQVVEATDNPAAKPKLLKSDHSLVRVFAQNSPELKNPVMILQLKRFGSSDFRVAVMRY